MTSLPRYNQMRFRAGDIYRITRVSTIIHRYYEECDTDFDKDDFVVVLADENQHNQVKVAYKTRILWVDSYDLFCISELEPA